MTRRAIVFDLFHTLIDPEPLYPPGFDKRGAIAATAGVDRHGLVEFWAETTVERETTTIDLVDLVDRHCRAFDRPLSRESRRTIDEILGVAVDQAICRPDPEVVALLAEARAVAALGVLSNCHEREVRHWNDSPLADRCDVFGRSSRIGAMKPDPSTYGWIVERLGVPAHDSIYVGNGGSDELAGARDAGFATVIHCNVYDRRNGLVDRSEQRRRAAQADISVDGMDDFVSAVRAALAGT